MQIYDSQFNRTHLYEKYVTASHARCTKVSAVSFAQGKETTVFFFLLCRITCALVPRTRTHFLSQPLEMDRKSMYCICSQFIVRLEFGRAVGCYDRFGSLCYKLCRRVTVRSSRSRERQIHHPTHTTAGAELSVVVSALPDPFRLPGLPLAPPAPASPPRRAPSDYAQKTGFKTRTHGHKLEFVCATEKNAHSSLQIKFNLCVFII